MVALRERGGRTFTHVTTTEAEGVKIAFQTAEDKTTFYADEASHWDALHARWPVRRINHSVAYSDLNGTSTNQVESYFSRLRRMVDGQHHHVSARYLHAYAAQAAWMEDHRRLSNGALCHRALGLALAHPVSRQWKGYWQRGRAGIDGRNCSRVHVSTNPTMGTISTVKEFAVTPKSAVSPIYRQNEKRWNKVIDAGLSVAI